MIARRTEREVDVCLIGLGAAGGMAAYVLTGAGKKVVALEAGPWRDGREHARDELQSSLARNFWGAAKFNREMPTWRQNRDSPALPAGYTMRMANGVGGSSGAYGAVSLRFHPDDFQVRTNTIARYGEAALPEGSDIMDWPLSYDDLEPYYDQAERLLGVSGQAGNLRGELVPGGNPFEGPRQRPYPMPALRTSGYGSLFIEAAERAGYHPFPMPAAVLTEPYDGRQACTYCGFCTRHSCHVGAKGSTLETVIPRALETGNLEIRTGSRVTSIAVDERGNLIGVEYDGPDGPVFQPASIVIVACYTFENSRLLLMSRSRHFPNGLGNNAGQVGRCFMPRQYPLVQGIIEERALNRYTGLMAQGQSIDDLNADNFDHTGLGFIRGGRITAPNQYGPISAQGSSSASGPPDVPRWGAAYKEFLVSSFNSVAVLNVENETLPYDANFLDLDPDVRDQNGVPVVRITFDIYENERLAGAYLQERGIELMRAMGATRLWCNSYFTGPVSTHDVGGTRMGTDPSKSVLDQYGRVHEAPGVYVLGGSMFPTLAGMNPTLTIQALALRSAEQIARAA